MTTDLKLELLADLLAAIPAEMAHNFVMKVAEDAPRSSAPRQRVSSTGCLPDTKPDWLMTMSFLMCCTRSPSRFAIGVRGGTAGLVAAPPALKCALRTQPKCRWDPSSRDPHARATDIYR
jgi:hypothetical protein